MATQLRTPAPSQLTPSAPHLDHHLVLKRMRDAVARKHHVLVAVQLPATRIECKWCRHQHAAAMDQAGGRPAAAASPRRRSHADQVAHGVVLPLHSESASVGDLGVGLEGHPASGWVRMLSGEASGGGKRAWRRGKRRWLPTHFLTPSGTTNFSCRSGAFMAPAAATTAALRRRQAGR